MWSVYAAPWFVSMPDLAATAAQLERDGTFQRAAAPRLALGDREVATRIMIAAINHRPQWTERYRAWGKHHGIAVADSVRVDTTLNARTCA